MYDIWLYSSQDWWRKCQISCYRKYRKFHFLPCVRQSGQNSKDQGSNPGWISKSFFFTIIQLSTWKRHVEMLYSVTCCMCRTLFWPAPDHTHQLYWKTKPVCSRLPYKYRIVLAKRPWVLAAQVSKRGCVVARKRCLNGSTIPRKGPLWMRS